MNKKRKVGKVVLVGAGPGDTGLLTLRGEALLRQADVVLYDWLVNPELLQLAPQAEKIFVGKKIKQREDSPSKGEPKGQKEIHQILLRFARKGKFVVRLKGGDPFLFGRGGEEASFLARHRISFEVVPGVSAGIGAPAYAGIPLTDRRFASEVAFVTAHENPTKEKSEVDWKKLASFPGTLVSFMGVKNLPRIVKALLQGGKAPETPVAVIEWGTLPRQRVVVGTLKTVLHKTQKARIESPALTVIGEVVRLRPSLSWFEKKPLRGKTVLVTRARAQASELVRRLREEGAEVLEFPTIEILPPSQPERIEEEIGQISKYDWVIFTSVNGVESFFERVRRLKKDARIFSNNKLAAIGEQTAQALAEKGLHADLVPPEFTSSSLFRSLKNGGEIQGKKFLLARSDLAPPDLRKALEGEGAEVVEVEAYRTRRAEGRGGADGRARLVDWLGKGTIDYLTFTSSSTVENFFGLIPRKFHKKIRSRFVSIGPVTTQTLREYGFEPTEEAQVHTIEGLVEALIKEARE